MTEVFDRGGRWSASAAVIRSIDLVGATLALVLSSPILVSTAVAVKATSRGPIIFRQERVGQAERRFEILKFRSMAVDNDDTAHRDHASALLLDPDAGPVDAGDTYKLDDPRVTMVGRFIRRFSIDELPQLWNVLRGDMSLVGPRPMLDWEAALLSETHRRRFHVRPGCSGLWQVSGRSTLSTHEMLDLDVEYVDRQSPTLDLAILARTPAAVLRGDGAR